MKGKEWKVYVKYLFGVDNTLFIKSGHQQRRLVVPVEIKFVGSGG